MKWKWLDTCALGIALAVLAGFSLFAYSNREGPAVVHIDADVELYYPLDSRQEVTVTGPLGKTVFEIRQGEVFVTASPCREQICVKQGSISRAGEWIACLPNRVLINIEADTHEEIDGTSY